MTIIFLILSLFLAPLLLALPIVPARTSVIGAAVYWGAYIPNVPWNMAVLTAFEQESGKGISIVHWGKPWMLNGQYLSFRTDEVNAVRAHGSIPMISWGSWQLGQGFNQTDFQLRDIYEGRHDAYIRQWAAAAAAWGHPLFLRFDHEMNGWWQFPWSVQLNGNAAADYVQAWRHVHDIFTQAGATNVTWVWCPNIVSARTTPLAVLYPGDDYVDWVALDGYNWGSDRGNVWQSFAEIVRPTYDQLSALAPTKPIMIAETASSEDGGPLGRPASKAAWISDAFTVQLPQHFPKIKAVLWFNWDDDDPVLDWPIDSSTAASAAWAQALASGYYASNQFASLLDTPIQPLLTQGLVPLDPTARAIQPGTSATYRFSVVDAAQSGSTITITLDDLPPNLSGSVTPMVLTSPGTVTLTLTDTHSPGPSAAGVWYSVALKATGDQYSQTVLVGLLVGGSRVYLPAARRNF